MIKFDDFCDLFNLTNLIRNKTCFTRNHKSAIDLILTNKPKSFRNTFITEAGLNDFHKLISTFFKTQITLLKPKIVFYRNYKHFEDSRFLEDLISTDFSFSTDYPNENYNFITDKFLNVVNRHTTLTRKTLMVDQVLLLTKELRKKIHQKQIKKYI